MNKQALVVLEEFSDDVEKLCDEILDLRNTIDEGGNHVNDLEEKIEKLQEEIDNHECK